MVLKNLKQNSITVVITTCDRTEQLTRAVRALAKQTYRNLDVVIVNDGVTSVEFDTKDISFPLKIINVGPYSGANNARLKGFQLATGEFVCFHDDDDYWFETKLEKQIKAFESSGEIVAVSCGAIASNKVSMVVKEVNGKALAYKNCVGSFSQPMIRCSAFEESFLPSDLANAQDWCAWICLTKKGRIVAIEEPLVFFDDGPHERISSRADKRKYYDNYIKVAEKAASGTVAIYYHRALRRYHITSSNLARLLFGSIIFIWRRFI